MGILRNVPHINNLCHFCITLLIYSPFFYTMTYYKNELAHHYEYKLLIKTCNEYFVDYQGISFIIANGWFFVNPYNKYEYCISLFLSQYTSINTPTRSSQSKNKKNKNKCNTEWQ